MSDFRDREAELLAEAKRIDREELDGEGDWRFGKARPPADPNMIYSIRLPIGAVETIRRLADRTGTPPTRLLREWVLDRIKLETQGASRVSEPAPAYGSPLLERRSGAAEVEWRLTTIQDEFAACVERYEREPLSGVGQLEWHVKTIRMRRKLRTPSRAVADAEFLSSLRTTLKRWRLGTRASVLVPQEAFARGLRAHKDELDSLAKLRLDDPKLAIDETIERLWALVEALPIVENKSKVVAATKTLHHLLPDLVPPMDIAWTGRFFRWYPSYFSSRQRKIFEQGMHAFAQLAQRTDPASYVGEGWKTSQSKVLDNAIIGFCKTHKIPPLM